MPGRSTTDAIFILKQTVEKHREGQKDIRVTFVDREKAYDRVSREEIWRCMRERSAREKYVKLIQDMYRGCQTKVCSAAGESGGFNVDLGLHQRSALSPYPFLILVDVLTEGVRKEVPECMMFADDIVLCGGRELDMTEYLDTWRTYLEERGMRVSRRKLNLWISILNGINKETEMLRWMCGVTRKDKSINEHIRGTTRVAQASKKITERRLNWYGHVMR